MAITPRNDTVSYVNASGNPQEAVGIALMATNINDTAIYEDALGNRQEAQAVVIVGGGGIVGGTIGGPVLTAIGDSHVDQNTRWILPPTASPSSAYFSDGPLSKWRSMSRQRINFPLKYDFGVSGDTIRQCLARKQSVIDAKADFAAVKIGSNSVVLADTGNTGGSFQEMCDDWTALVKPIRESGKTVMVYPIPPRAGATLTTAQILKQQRFTNYQREFCRNNRGYIFIDYLKYMTDQASATGGPLAGMLKADNLHEAAAGAQVEAKATQEQMDRYLPPFIGMMTSATDYYDATNNPSGSLLRSGTTNYSTMAGTTGTHTASTGFTTSGDLATGFTSVKSGGTATTVATCSKGGAVDGASSGVSQIVALAVTVAGGADEIHNLRATPALADVQAGDWYYAELVLETQVAPVNINAIELYLLETRPSNSQTAIDGAWNSVLSLKLPSVVGIETLRTPPIQRQSDATALQVNLRTRMDTTSGAASVTYRVANFVVRKINPDFV